MLCKCMAYFLCHVLKKKTMNFYVDMAVCVTVVVEVMSALHEYVSYHHFFNKLQEQKHVQNTQHPHVDVISY